MTDAISVIGPGWRATDTSGNIITDGILAFFDAGTSNTRTVYSDSSLSTSLGTTVDCNSGGYPVTSGNSRTLIYTGNTAYKVRLTSATVGGTVWEHDNVLGALDTSNFLTEAAVADRSVVTVSTNRAVTVADKGKIIDVNCSGGDITLTFDDAADLGDGFYVAIRHNGTANQVKITGDGTDTFGIPGTNVTGFSLIGRGQGCTITCDATNFKVDATTPPFVGGAPGVVQVANLLSTPPGSPEAGERHIVGASPTGAWSGFSEHDLAEADGFGNWNNYTFPSDSGILAYVQAFNAFMALKGSAWEGATQVNAQVFTSSGTYTPSAWVGAAIAICIGGGGGGGGVAAGDGSTGSAAGGGGAGGCSIEVISPTTIGASQAVTIGAGGTAGSDAGGNGGDGGTSSLGALLSAAGGTGGSGTTNTANNPIMIGGGAGGAGSGGDVNMTGSGGTFGASDGSVTAAGGTGGASLFAGGGVGGYRASAGGSSNGAAGTLGGGGGGAALVNSGTSRSGGAGGGGVVMIIELG